MTSEFDIICEIEPPTSPDMGLVREQIAVLRGVCDRFLVPDSHMGRATVSSVSVAHEVDYLQAPAIACLNARDRNLLGFRRDLLTAAAYGVTDLLFVYGDAPSHGERSEMTVRRMLKEVEAADVDVSFRVGVAADVRKPLPAWKQDADFAFTQICFDLDAVDRWRNHSEFEGQVYAGVMVFASEKMARRLADVIPGLDVPDDVLRELAEDPDRGVEIAVEQLLRLRDAGTVDGVHLVPAGRYRQTADRLRLAGI